MTLIIDHGQRVARKGHRCGLCNAAIRPGDHHAYQVNVYDGRIYTWRDCLPCNRDGVITYVNDWDGGWSDEGIDYEKAGQWAEEAIAWPRYWDRHNRVIDGSERTAARNWLARAAGDE